MIPNFEAAGDALPENGVIVVEHYWHPRLRATPQYPAENTSMAFFRRIRAADKCWCGSGKKFGRCHRRTDDWTFVTLDPDQRAYSPIVLCERQYPVADSEKTRAALIQGEGFAVVLDAAPQTAWSVLAVPIIENEIGRLSLGTVELDGQVLHFEANSETRFQWLSARIEQLLGGSIGAGTTHKADPQKQFHRARR
jgi:hypothetical protein